MKKLITISLTFLLLLGLAACNRSRQPVDSGTGNPAPANTQPAAPQATSTPLPSVAAPTQAPTITPIPPTQPQPSLTPLPNSGQSPAAATAAAELDQTLNSLEQSLGQMDTNINIP